MTKKSYMIRHALDIRVVLIAIFGLVVGRELLDSATASKRPEVALPDKPSAVLVHQEAARVREENRTTFLAYLQEGYFRFARSQDNVVTPDWNDAHYFRAKALGIQRGEMALPENLESWELAEPGPGIFESARERLIAARNILLTQADATPRTLSDLANAQVYFDCWIERAEERWNSEDAQYCQYMFESSLEAAYPQHLSATSTAMPLYQ